MRPDAKLDHALSELGRSVDDEVVEFFRVANGECPALSLTRFDSGKGIIGLLVHCGDDLLCEALDVRFDRGADLVNCGLQIGFG